MFQTDSMIKLGFLGQSNVGKTHIIHRYLTNSFPQKLTSTIAIQFALGYYKMQDGTKLKLKICDTSGQQKYKQIVCYHLKQVQAIIVVYDITNEKSFSRIDQWINKIQRQQIEDKYLVLIGNKSDLKDSRRVDSKRGEQKAIQIGAQFYQMSSFDYEEVSQVISQIIENLIERKADIQIEKRNKQQLKSIKNETKLLPLRVQQSGAGDAVCSNCQLY